MNEERTTDLSAKNLHRGYSGALSGRIKNTVLLIKSVSIAVCVIATLKFFCMLRPHKSLNCSKPPGVSESSETMASLIKICCEADSSGEEGKNMLGKKIM